jgi:hypothetical protein
MVGESAVISISERRTRSRMRSSFALMPTTMLSVSEVVAWIDLSNTGARSGVIASRESHYFSADYGEE